VKLPLVTGERMCKIVSKLGFEMAHQTGSHTVWKHRDGRTTTIPVHPGRELPRGLVRKILKDVDMSVDEYIRLR
jgi:predicted RNA binding protein YcfA (HicA-like mRNA interferase family)